MSQPIPVTVTRYQCPHCRSTRSKKQAAANHIARCWRNPEVRGCKTCIHLTPSEEGPFPGHPGWPQGCNEGRDITASLVTDCPYWADTESAD